MSFTLPVTTVFGSQASYWQAMTLRVDFIAKVALAEIGLYASSDAAAAGAAPLQVEQISIPFGPDVPLSVSGASLVESYCINNVPEFAGGDPNP